MKNVLKKAQERLAKAQEAVLALDLNDDAGDLDLDKLEKCAELEGETRAEKLAKYTAMAKECKEAREELDVLVEAEKAQRELNKSMPTSDKSDADKDEKKAKDATSEKTIGGAFRVVAKGRDLSEEVVKVSRGGGDLGMKALFNVSPDSIHYNNRFPILATNLGRYEQVLNMVGSVSIPEGESTMKQIEMRPGTVDSTRRGRDTTTATTEGNVSAFGQEFQVKERHIWQPISRLTAGDHTGYVSNVMNEMENELMEDIWDDLLNGDGTGNEVLGAMAQITNTKAVADNTVIIKWFEDEIERMRFEGGDPRVVLCDIALWSTLAEAYRELNFKYPDDYLSVHGVLFLPAPDMPANTALLTDPSKIILGVRGSRINSSSNPYTLAASSQHFLEVYTHIAVEVMYGKTESRNKYHLKITATDKFIPKATS